METLEKTHRTTKAIALCLTGVNMELLRLSVRGSEEKTRFLKFEMPNREFVYVNLDEVKDIIFNGVKREATITYHEDDYTTVIRGKEDCWELMRSALTAS